MGLIKKMTGHSFDEIVSVVILEQTQLYKSETKWGMTFGSKGFLGSDVIAMDGGQVPDGLVITFSITYRDGEKEIVKERSGTERCDHLLQLAMVSSSVIPSDKGSRSEPKADEPIVLQKN